MSAGKTMRETKKVHPMRFFVGVFGVKSAEITVFVFPLLGTIKVDIDIGPVARMGFAGFGNENESQESSAADKN